MKKIALTLITATLLTACADSGTAGVGGLLGGGAGTSSAAGIGKSAVQMYVQNRCVNENRNQRPRLFAIPAPVATPTLVRPNAA